jgi:MFS family permease
MLAQFFQIPSVSLIEKTGNRRLISFRVTIISRLFIVAIALIPFFFTGKIALGVLVAALILNTTLGSISLCAWNSWMRDLVPQEIMGSFFGRRLSLMTGFGVILSLGAGIFIDYWESHMANKTIFVYSILFGLAWLSGLLDTYFISKIPEPRMITRTKKISLKELLFKPLHDKNFARLIHFLGTWNFAVNLAAPFFTVYLLVRLEMPMSFVIGFTVLSQIVNMVFLRLWGKFGDRFSYKNLLSLNGPLFMLSILGWTFTTMPEKHGFTIPLLIFVHILMGISIAGVTLGTNNIALKLAPKGEATAYLATSSMVNYISAGLAPIVGGLSIDFFSKREFSWAMTWRAPGSEYVFQTLNFQAWDFFFGIAFIIGMYSLHRLALIKEKGEVTERTARRELLHRIARPLRNFSSAGGLKYLFHYPLIKLKNRDNKQNNSV